MLFDTRHRCTNVPGWYNGYVVRLNRILNTRNLRLVADVRIFRRRQRRAISLVIFLFLIS